MKLFEILVVLCLVMATPVRGRNECPACPSNPVPVYNPVNTITINNCNRTEEDRDIIHELNVINERLNTLMTSLEDGDYCPKGPSYPRDCYEVHEGGETVSGVYIIQPTGTVSFQVYCDMETDGGGWTVFQRRQDGSVNFYRNWEAYANGFGSLEGEHWLGNNNLHYLTSQKTYGLRVDLGDFDNTTRFAKYDSFVVADSTDKYRLQIRSYSGNAGDAMSLCHGQKFSTLDQDNDATATDEHCAMRYKGAWWYEKCHHSNLNGVYHEGVYSSLADGVVWLMWKGYQYSLKLSEMKLRPV